MEFVQAIVLGIVQGLTEFLPVSSSAHLFLVPFFLGWLTPGLVFDTSLHLGTLVAVLLYFQKDASLLFKGWITSLKTRKINETPDSYLAWLIIFATFPAGVIGLAFEDLIEAKLHGPLGPSIIMWMLIIVAILLFLVDRKSAGEKTVYDVGIKIAMIIGFAQALALIPGTSRSGITMLAGLMMGLSRTESARFSFLLGIPVIGAGGLFKLKDLFEEEITMEVLLYFGLGFLAAAISGYLCIRFLLKFLQSHSFTPFVIYRIILGLTIMGIITLG